MRVRLTDALIRSLNPTEGRLEVWDENVTGLVLRVTPGGAKTWAVWYRVNGVARRFTLADYRSPHSQTHGMTLADARARAVEVLAAARLGEDRQAGRIEARRRKADEALRAGPLTVQQLVERCLAALDLRPKTRREWERLSRVEIIPALGRRHASNLSKAEVRDWAEAIVGRSHYTANRAFEVLRRAYTWGLGRDYLSSTPFLALAKPGTERESERVLSAEEMRAVWLALDDLLAATASSANSGDKAGANRLNERRAYVDATRLLLLTGVRRDMVLGVMRAEFDDLDGDNPRWTIPGGFAGRSKSGRPHVVPLSMQAVTIIKRRCEEAKGAALFPVNRRGNRTAGNPDKPMTWSSRFVRELRAHANERLGAEMPRWTIHNLRHTIGTHLREDLDASAEVVSLILGHAPPGPRVTRVYNRAERLQERRAALTAWADLIARLITRESDVRVLPFRR